VVWLALIMYAVTVGSAVTAMCLNPSRVRGVMSALAFMSFVVTITLVWNIGVL
jgi:hypothetical protein